MGIGEISSSNIHFGSGVCLKRVAQPHIPPSLHQMLGVIPWFLLVNTFFFDQFTINLI